MTRVHLLQRALRGNALFSAFSGLMILLAPGPLARVLALSDGSVLSALGWVLLTFSAGLVALSRSPGQRPGLVLSVVLSDLVWVLASGVLILGFPQPLSVAGALLVAGVALVVATFLLFQLAGLRALVLNRSLRSSATSELEIRRLLPVAPDELWSHLGELEKIADYAPHLAESRLDSGRGLGAIRTCRDQHGGCWRERCTEYEAGRSITLEFDTSGPDFPAPMHQMVGGWTLRPDPEGTCVTVWFELTPKGGWLGQALLPLLFPRLERQLVTTLEHMVRATKPELEESPAGLSPAGKVALLPC